MNKINHVKRVRNEARDREFYENLVDNAAGAEEAEIHFEKCVEKLTAKGMDELEASEILLDYACALQENGFNAGFEHGFQQGSLLGVYGSKAS